MPQAGENVSDGKGEHVQREDSDREELAESQEADQSPHKGFVLVFALKSEDPDKFGDLEELPETWNFCHFEKDGVTPCLAENEVERENADQIDPEPELEVDEGNCFRTCDQFEIDVEGSKERQHNITEEEAVYCKLRKVP
jgi:hypothetical protein